MKTFIRVPCSGTTCEANWISLKAITQITVTNAGEGNPELYTVNLIANGSGLGSFNFTTTGEATSFAEHIMDRIQETR